MYFKVNNVIRLCLLFFSILLLGCSRPQLAPLQDGDVILAFGDSLTFGYGVEKSQSYPAKLSELTGLKVVNAGISGETTTQGLKRLADVLAEHQPQLVILLEGGNDLLRKQKEPIIKANLKRIILMIQEAGAEVLLVGVPEKKLFGGSLKLYEELADEMQLPLQDSIVSNLMHRPSMKSDYVHFNARGYEELAKAIYELMIDSGAIEN